MFTMLFMSEIKMVDFATIIIIYLSYWIGYELRILMVILKPHPIFSHI